MNNIPEFTVTQLNRSIKNLLEEKFEYVKLVGESGPITFANSGHVYFSIKENDEVISCICWKGNYERLDLKIEEGVEYNFYGRVTSYSKFGRSVYQLIIDQIEYSGVGSILQIIEERRKKLTEGGYFDEKHKTSLPKYPKRIGVLTSPSGSVIHDIIQRIEDRFPLTQIALYPISVQGKNSHIEIIEFLNLIESSEEDNKPDLVIFARGGGSLEEMMPFNEIELIKRVFDLKIPSISAIGHETDNTLLDSVCDLRAPTPTAAAELAVPNQIQVLNYLDNKKIALVEFLKKRIKEYEYLIIKHDTSVSFLSKKVYETEKKMGFLINSIQKNLNNFYNYKKNLIYKKLSKINEYNPKQKISIFENKVNNLNKNNKIFLFNKLKFLRKQISLLQKVINSSSLEKNLKKGYAVIKKDKTIIKSIKNLKNFDQFSILMKDGKFIIKK